MTYDVLREFTDEEVGIANAEGEKEPLHRNVGETFIPAEILYPQYKVDALVANGTLKLVNKTTAEAPAKAPAKKK